MSPKAARPGAVVDGRSGWRRVVRSPPARRAALIIGLLLLLEYAVIPALVGASRNLNLLSRLDIGWLIAGTVLEAASLLSYALLTRGLLLGKRPGLFTLVRITVATTAVSHLVPVGAAGSAGLGYQLLTVRGVMGTEAGLALATGAVGSAVVLNMCLLLALLISIPLAGLHPIFVVMALVGVLALLGSYALVYLLTRDEARAVQAVRAVGRRGPRIGADRLEGVIRDFADSLAALIADRRLLRDAVHRRQGRP